MAKTPYGVLAILSAIGLINLCTGILSPLPYFSYIKLSGRSNSFVFISLFNGVQLLKERISSFFFPLKVEPIKGGYHEGKQTGRDL